VAGSDAADGATAPAAAATNHLANVEALLASASAALFTSAVAGQPVESTTAAIGAGTPDAAAAADPLTQQRAATAALASATEYWHAAVQADEAESNARKEATDALVAAHARAAAELGSDAIGALQRQLAEAQAKAAAVQAELAAANEKISVQGRMIKLYQTKPAAGAAGGQAPRA
jgi:colicin import membrane protein